MKLPWEYAGPMGQLLLATKDDDAVGCIAMRSLGSGRGEMRRLYVRPRYRSMGAGRDLVRQLIEDARQLGYAQMLLNTLPSMIAARALYRNFGFVETEPYGDSPTAGVIYLALALR